MSLRIHGSDLVHRLGKVDSDIRLSYTRCGIRFAWGNVHTWATKLARCPGCWR